MKLPIFSMTENLPLDFSHTATGGMAMGGAATIAFEPYEVVMTGGMAMGGAATVEFEPFELVMSGGMAMGGTATVTFEYTMPAMEGGMVMGGSPLISFVYPLDFETSDHAHMAMGGGATYEFVGDVMTGGLSMGGAATIEFGPPDVAIEAECAPSTIAIEATLYNFGLLEADGAAATAVLVGAQGNTGTITAERESRGTAVLTAGFQFLEATAPVPTASITAIMGHNGEIVASAPKSTVEFTASITQLGTISAQLTRAPYATLTATRGVTGTLAASAPLPTAALTGYVTITGVITAESPLPTTAFTGSQGGYGTIVTSVGIGRAYFTASYTPSISDLVDTVVVNTITAAVTEYEDYEYDSFCRIGSTTYGASATGIFELDSAGTDNGTAIAAYFETGDLDFDSEYLKRFESLYAAYRTTGDIHVTVRTDEGTAYTYIMKYDQVPTLKRRRVPIGKGLRGSYWRVKVANVAGSSFDIDSLNALAHETVRRVG